MSNPNSVPGVWGPVARQLWLVVVGLALMLVLKENYPFSHFPMYSRNSEKTYVVHITDGEDKPIVFRQQFGRSVIRVKKIFDKAVARAKKDPDFEGKSREETEQILGIATLRQAVEERIPRVEDPESYDVLRLWKTDLQLEGSEIEERSYLVAEIRVDEE
jgi:hypothetical protein